MESESTYSSLFFSIIPFLNFIFYIFNGVGVNALAEKHEQI